MVFVTRVPARAMSEVKTSSRVEKVRANRANILNISVATRIIAFFLSGYSSIIGVAYDILLVEAMLDVG